MVPRDILELREMETSKLEAFDLVIKVLREHEESLDNLLDRLDTLIEALSILLVRLEHLTEQAEKPTQT
jgi:hypothetical protein